MSRRDYKKYFFKWRVLKPELNDSKHSESTKGQRIPRGGAREGKSLNVFRLESGTERG